MSLSWDDIKKASETLQENMKKAHEELLSLEVTGTDENEMVTVTMQGNFRVTAVNIDPKAVTSIDAANLAEKFKYACNDAVDQIEQTSNRRMQDMALQLDADKPTKE